MIGKNISTLLYKQHKTQVWLSQQCGVTKGHINQIISGKANPSIKLLLKISKAFSVNVDEIIDNNFE